VGYLEVDNMADSVFILAILTPKEGKVDEVAEGMAKLAKVVEENEPGCLSYGLFTNKDKTQVIAIEQYKDMEAIAAHRASAHMQEAMKSGKDELASPPDIQLLTAIGGFQRS